MVAKRLMHEHKYISLLFQVEKGLLQEEARYAQKENQELRQQTQLLRLRNTELEDQVQCCAPVSIHGQDLTAVLQQ
jgi:hypothetical protein